MALPLFIYSGNLMSCGATQRLMRFADMILGKIPGGLGTAACGGAAFFGSVSGSAVATSAAIGSIMGPEMVDRGYGKSNYKYTAKEVLTITLQAIPALAMPVFVLGSIMSGIATATEAAAISVIYAFLLAAFAYGEMNFKQFVEITKQSAMGTAFIFIIISASAPFGWVLAKNNIPMILANAILSISSSKFVITFLVVLLLIILGTFMETNSLLILLTPILWPVMESIGYNVVHFGIILCVAFAIGGCTPPMAVCLFTTTRILNIKVEDTFPDIFIICATMVVILILITLIPEISLFLPSLSG